MYVVYHHPSKQSRDAHFSLIDHRLLAFGRLVNLRCVKTYYQVISLTVTYKRYVYARPYYSNMKLLSDAFPSDNEDVRRSLHVLSVCSSMLLVKLAACTHEASLH